MSQPVIQFGRVPYSIGDSGIISRMKPSDARLYLAMAIHANANWQVTAGLRRLAELIGMKLGTASEAARRLEALGAISIDWPGNGHPAIYILTVQHVPNGLPFSAHRTDQSGDRSAHTGGTVRQSPAKPFSAHRTKQIEQNKNRAQAAPAADADASGKTRKSGKRSSRRDDVFETLAEVCGLALDQLTTCARGQLNKATKQLREVGAVPAEIHRRAVVYAERFPSAAMTPTALAKHWPALGNKSTRKPIPRDANGRTPHELDSAMLVD